MGFFKAHSTPSLVLGCGTGLILLLLSLRWKTGKKIYIYPIFILLLFLDAFFSYRFVMTWKVFPPGVFSLLTSSLIIYLYKNKKINII